MSLSFGYAHFQCSRALPAVISNPNSPTAREWHCGVYEYASSSDGNPDTIRLSHWLADCSDRHRTGHGGKWVLLLLSSANRRQLHKCLSDVRSLYTTVRPSSLQSLRFGLSYQDFVTWNNNPSSPCPSLTPDTFVCVDVLNITDTAPPIPTNAAPGSGPSVSLSLPNLSFCDLLGTYHYAGMLRVVHHCRWRWLWLSRN